MYLLADAIWRRFPTVLGHDGAHLELHRRAGLPVHRGTVRPTTVTPPETRPFRPKGGWRGSAEPIRLAPTWIPPMPSPRGLASCWSTTISPIARASAPSAPNRV